MIVPFSTSPLSARHPSLACALALCLTLLATACDTGPRFVGEPVAPSGEPPHLVGTDWDGEPFDLADERGKVAVVFFGYTFCPDVCPLALARMKQLYGELGDRADEVSVVFASVDPHRDTVAKLADYVPHFDERFHGVRLEFDQLEEVQEDFDVTVQYGQPQDGPGTDSYYYVDHTGSFFLFDREGELRVIHPPNAGLEELLPDVETLLDA